MKVVQIVFAHHINDGSKSDYMQKELLFSLQKSYDLYHYLLMFLVDLHRVAVRQVEACIQRWHRVHIGTEPSRRFIDNPFIMQLEDNEQLRAYCANDKWRWDEHEKYLIKVYDQIQDSDFYIEYMNKEAPTYDDHREVWYRIYLQFVCNNEFIDSLLEDQSLYWNDDKHLVDSFVLKTIQHFNQKKGGAQPLLKDFRNEEDRQFAVNLLQATVNGADEYSKIIAKHLQSGWDMNRIAQMDMVVMLVALAEIINLPDIPLNVSMNEYIEIAKSYSTPQSGAYVNGMLDAMVHTLQKQGLITKERTHSK